MNKNCWSNYTSLKQYRELYQEPSTIDTFINCCLKVGCGLILVGSMVALSIIFLAQGV